MSKKSLLISIAVFMTAIFFVLTGCEGPAGPTGNDGQDGQVGPSQIGIDGITIKVEEPGVTLPDGFTYPANGAKVVAGNATDIAIAFNGGIFVADTSDATGQGVAGAGTVAGTGGGAGTAGSGVGTDYVYAQDGVDQVIWTGPGTKAAITTGLGAISVPPGKTLFIAAPLAINASATTGVAFTGISVSDQGSLPAATLSIQQAQGGAKIDADSKGTLVVLAGAVISDSAASTFTIGGNLEIHQGGKVTFTNTTIETTAGSKTRVFGQVSAATVTANGELSIEGRGSVTASGTGSTFFDTTITGLSTLAVNTATFTGKVSVAETAQVTASGAITINDEFALDGLLTVSSNNVTLANNGTSHLKVSAAGRIKADKWDQFIFNGSGAIDKTLLAAIDSSAEPSADNNRITIAAAADKQIYLDVGTVEATSYASFVSLLGNESLHLVEVDYIGPPSTADLAANDLVVAKGNYGKLIAATGSTWPVTALGNITVQNGGALDLGSSVIASAGNITILGKGRSAIGALTSSGTPVAFTASAATFGTALTSLTLGNEDGVETAVELPAATLASISEPNTAITIDKNAVLLLNAQLAVNPPGKIELKAGDTGKENGGKLGFASASASGAAAPAATFAALDELIVGAEAEFDGWYEYADSSGGGTLTYARTAVTTISFADLTKLTVNGSLVVPTDSSTVTAFFNKLQTHVASGKSDVKTDSGTTGKAEAIFEGWDINGESNGHAFDQILGIRNVTVKSLVNVPNTSGLDKGQTTDKADTVTGGNFNLTVIGSITVPNGKKLTIDRNLNLYTTSGTPSSIIFGANGGTISIIKETKVSSAGDPVLEGTDLTALTASAVATLAVSGAGALEATSTATGTTITLVDPKSIVATTSYDNVLKVPGKLAAGTNVSILAGKAGSAKSGLVTLVASSLTDGSITSKTQNADKAAVGIITVEKDGVLSIGGASSVLGYTADATLNAKSYVELKEDASIATSASGILSFAGSSTTGINIGVDSKVVATADSKIIADSLKETGDQYGLVTGTPAEIFIDQAEITGALTVEKGTLNVPTSTPAGSSAPYKRLHLDSGVVKVSKSGSGYDYASLTKSDLVQQVTFNAGTGTILLTGTGMVKGNASTKLNAKGSGSLVIGTLATLKNATDHSLNVTLTGADGLQEGALSLSGSLLSIEATGFKVGVTGKTASLTVGTGTVAIKNTATIVVGGADTSGNKGSFTLSNATISGTVASGAIGDGIDRGDKDNDVAITDVNNLITPNGTLGKTPVSGSGNLGQVTYVTATGVYTITGKGAAATDYNNINGESKLYLGDTA